MTETKYCPCCGRHCDLSEPRCERGREYLRTGMAAHPEHGHWDHGRPGQGRHGGRSVRGTEEYAAMDTDAKLIVNLREMGRRLRFLQEGRESQKEILILLRERGGMTQRELTKRLGIQPGSASEVIGKLEDTGLIRRTESAADRRTADIRLTEAGQVQAEEAAGRQKIHHEQIFSCLTQEEKGTLLALAEKLNGDWDGRWHEHGPHGCHGRHEPEGWGRHGGGRGH